jgi:hypothetical protein
MCVLEFEHVLTQLCELAFEVGEEFFEFVHCVIVEVGIRMPRFIRWGRSAVAARVL